MRENIARLSSIANHRWLLSVAGSLAVFLREPSFFFAPRLWAEEGTRYYSYAYHFSQSSSWYLGLVNVQRGYFALWPNVASTIAANLVPVEQAPLITTIMAFLIQLVPIFLIAWSKADFWASAPRRIIGILAYLLTPISQEIWLNTINSQFFLALVTVLILLDPISNERPRKWTYRCLLVLAGLTGLASDILVPIFVLLAWLTRERERAIQGFVLGLCALIQLAVLVWPSTGHGTMGVRLMDGRLSPLIFSVWSQSIGLLLGGTDLMGKFAVWILDGYKHNTFNLILAASGLAVLEISFLGWLVIHLPVRERIILLGSYVILVGLSYFGSLLRNKLVLIVPGNVTRYFWVPNMIIGLLLTANMFNRTNGRFKIWISTVLLCIVLMWGCMEYLVSPVRTQSGPSWRTEVAQWRADPSRKVGIWPEGWRITLQR